ncbi:MAG: hypothetical protein WCP28_12885, partial [Actinomycetes bacterium]
TTCGITATKAGDTNYNPVNSPEQTVTVGKANQTIDFTPPPNTTLATATVSVSGTATSGLPVTFSTATPAVCTVSGTTVTLVTVGTCTLHANQAGNSTYNAAPQKDGTFHIAINPALIPTFDTPVPTTDGFTVHITNYDPAFTWAGTATGGGSVTITNSGLVTVSGLPAAATSTATITTSRADYEDGSASVVGNGAAADTATVSLVGLPEQTVIGEQVTVNVVITDGRMVQRSKPATTQRDARTTSGIVGSAIVKLNGNYACTAPISNGHGSCVARVTTAGKLTFTATFTGTINGTATTSAAPAVQTATSAKVAITKSRATIRRCRMVVSLNGLDFKAGRPITIWVRVQQRWVKVAATRSGPAKTWVVRFFTNRSQLQVIARDAGSSSAPITVKVRPASPQMVRGDC